MSTVLFSLLAIHALSAGALAKPASSDSRSGGFGSIGQDANLTVYTFDNEICAAPPLASISSVNLSWGLMQLTNGNAQSFDISRDLRDAERLDWSTFAPTPPGANEARFKRVFPGCEHYLKSTSTDPVGNVLQAQTCTPLGMVANCVNVLVG